MKHTTLTPPPLKIAIISAILGLGAVSGANAQTQSEYSERIKQIQETANNRIQKLKLIESEDDDFNLKQGKLDQKKFQQYMVIKQSANNSTMMVLNEHAEKTTQKLENLRKLFSWTTPTIGNNTQGVATNKADIAANKDDIQNNINNIYELAQQQDQHSSDIKNLGKASLTNTKRITTTELGIAENKKDALIAKAQANQNKAYITTNKADITKNKATLAQHAKKIDDNQQAIEAKLSGKVDTQKLVDLETKVKQNQGEVDKKLATVQENYNQLNTQVQSVDNKIGMVDTRVNALDDKVENSMAAQAALNGLFQPYNVGKVSVSVAVGAYGSKSAIAVGAGYRVNPHLAFKGGAAINTSGSRKGSYNLGINYEF